MAEESEKKLSFETADDLTSFLMDLQGQIVNIQETVDKISPAEEAEATEETEETASDDEETEEPSEEELSEIDALLQNK